MTLRQALTPKSQQDPKPSSRNTANLENVLERLIATLNRIENKLDKI